MHRLIARFLLLFAFAGNLAPLALAATTAAPSHACCLRKGVHRCHESARSESIDLIIRATGCCHQDCCRAVTTARWARAQQAAGCVIAGNVEAYFVHQNLVAPNTEVSRFQSTRAPPVSTQLFS
jgi:hypothetical protein